MAYPAFHASGPSGSQGVTQGHAPGVTAAQLSAVGSLGATHPPRPATTAPCEGEHQLEKLEFALAVALTRGDLERSQRLREAIAALGGNLEEPGT